MEPRAAAKVNSGGRNTCRTQRRESVSHEVDWIRKQRRGIQRGVLVSSAADPAGIPAVRVAGFANPHGSAETTTRPCQPGGEGHTFGADSESEFLGLQLWASTPVASPAALRHHPRQAPRALTRMRGSVRGDWRKPVPYRDALRRTIRELATTNRSARHILCSLTHRYE